MHCWRDLSQTVQDVHSMIRGVAESSFYLLYMTSDALSYYATIEARAAVALRKPNASSSRRTTSASRAMPAAMAIGGRVI